MPTARISFAMAHGGLDLPEGRFVLLGIDPDCDLSELPDGDVTALTTLQTETRRWQDQGMDVVADATGPYDTAIVALPRARDLALARLAQAERLAPKGLIVLDGAKTDGIDGVIKALRARVTLEGQVSKAHGKCLWFQASDRLTDWQLAPQRTPDGDLTMPGVFSADGPDPASVALAKVLPAKLKGKVADLGAGWGWLSREVLRFDAVKALHMVEVDKLALDCARANVSDERAAFHWQDALDWKPPTPLDAVVMNPPFHTSRKAEPALGRAFIAAAAGMLAPHGQLWMVANRHLPYEATIAEHFIEMTEIAGDSRFKIFHAARPSRLRRGRALQSSHRH